MLSLEDCEGHAKTFSFRLLRWSIVDFELGLGSISCCRSHPLFIFSIVFIQSDIICFQNLLVFNWLRSSLYPLDYELRKLLPENTLPSSNSLLLLDRHQLLSFFILLSIIVLGSPWLLIVGTRFEKSEHFENTVHSLKCEKCHFLWNLHHLAFSNKDCELAIALRNELRSETLVNVNSAQISWGPQTFARCSFPSSPLYFFSLILLEMLKTMLIFDFGFWISVHLRNYS